MDGGVLSNMRKPEILAPAGTKEALIGAINAGAHAVYLAGKRFGARAYASNFDDDTLIEVINYAHLRGVLVFVAINTVIYDDEMKDLLAYTDFLAEHHVDAFIVQDLGVISLLTQRYQHVEIHASTQMNTHTIEQAKWLKDMGVKRIVLARETSLDTIKMIKKHVDIDLEVFVHGALCVCYSGQCLMSSMIGGRSGNRGECAQPCRLPYALYKNQTKISDESYLLSTKDLMTLEYLDELIDAGIDSFKIEGRMRKPEYVIETVKDYRYALDQYLERRKSDLRQSIWNLKKVFNREFTKGFIMNEKPKDMNHNLRPNHMGVPLGQVIHYTKNKVTIRLEESLSINDGYRILSDQDYGNSVSRILKQGQLVTHAVPGDVITLDVDQQIVVGSTVLKTLDYEHEQSLAKYLDENYKLIKLRGSLSSFVGKPLELTVTDGTYEVTIISDFLVEKALNQPISKQQYIDQISKLGQTPFYFESLEIETDGLGFVAIKHINDIRRKAIDELSEQRLKRDQETPFVKPKHLILSESIYHPWSIHVQTKEQYDIAKSLDFDHVFYENIINIDDESAIPVLKRIQSRQHEAIQKHAMIQDIGHLYQAKTADIYTDQYFNVTNIYAVNLLHQEGVKRVTLSPELSHERILKMIDLFVDTFGYLPRLELQVYGRHDLMISKYCPIAKTFKTNQDCHLCEKNQYYLEDRLKQKYPLVHDGNCHLRILHAKTLNLLDYANELQKHRITCRIHLTTEDEKETRNILSSIKQQKLYPYQSKTMTLGRFIK
jgi:putative protease